MESDRIRHLCLLIWGEGLNFTPFISSFSKVLHTNLRCRVHWCSCVSFPSKIFVPPLLWHSPVKGLVRDGRWDDTSETVSRRGRQLESEGIVGLAGRVHGMITRAPRPTRRDGTLGSSVGNEAHMSALLSVCNDGRTHGAGGGPPNIGHAPHRPRCTSRQRLGLVVATSGSRAGSGGTGNERSQRRRNRRRRRRRRPPLRRITERGAASTPRQSRAGRPLGALGVPLSR